MKLALVPLVTAAWASHFGSLPEAVSPLVVWLLSGILAPATVALLAIIVLLPIRKPSPPE
jgi:hypothetical protein